MRKAICVGMITVLLAVLCLTAAMGEAGYTDPETGFSAVTDDAAGLLDAAGLESVLEEMKPITQYCNVGFTTYRGSSNTPVKKKAESWARQQFGTESYTVFMIDLQTIKLGIYSSESMYRLISTGKANTITDNVSRMATRGEYAECAGEAFRQMLKTIRGEEIAAPMKIISNALLAMIGAIFLSYALITARMRQEEEISIPDVVNLSAAGLATAVTAHVLTRKVRHSSGSGGGGHGGGGGFSGGGGGGGGSHGF